MISRAIESVLDEIQVGRSGTVVDMGPWHLEAAEPRDVEKQLGRALYERLHLRRLSPMDTRARMVRDHRFEADLRAALPHDRVSVPVEMLGVDSGNAHFVVRLMGARVRIPIEAVTTGASGLVARIPASHPALSPGFLMVHGSRPVAVSTPSDLVRMYLNPRDPGSAVDLWRTATALLEESGNGYRAKVASVRWFYPRTDAITIYLSSHDLPDLSQFAARISQGRMHLLSPDTSYLAHRLAPGIATACEPADTEPGRRGLSFGEHRSSLLAAAAMAGHRAGDGWRAHLVEVLAAGAVDSICLWRNAHAPQTRSVAAPPDRSSQTYREEVQI